MGRNSHAHHARGKHDRRNMRNAGFTPKQPQQSFSGDFHKHCAVTAAGPESCDPKSLLSLSTECRSDVPSASSTPNNTPTKLSTGSQTPKRDTFSPRKLTTLFKVVKGSGILDGGADYSKGRCVAGAGFKYESSTSVTASSHDSSESQAEDIISDQDLLVLCEDMDQDPDFTDNLMSSTSAVIAPQQSPDPFVDPDLVSFSQDMDHDPDFKVEPTCSMSLEQAANTPEDDPDLITLSQDMDDDPDLSGFSTGDSGFSCSGTTDGDQPLDYFALLPPEVMENVFCRLPILDLCLHMTRVCQRWNEIISGPKFLCRKKTYFRVLRGSQEHREKVLSEMSSHEMNIDDVSSLLPGLIRHMRSYKPVTSPNMTNCLKRHNKYCWAVVLLQERLADCILHDEASPWSVVTALVVLSEDVDDILSIVTCLLNPPSQCTGQEVIECLYCVATYLLVFQSIRYDDCWTGMHYRVFYALYLYENSSLVISESSPQQPGSPGKCLPVPPGSSLQYTQEQMRICNHDVSPGDVIKIVAFAGTGKTTTLIRYSQLRPYTSFLMIVFNKSVQEDCCKRFPPNVECLTSHALARRSAVGCVYREDQIGSIRVCDIIDHIPRRRGENFYHHAKFILETFNKFMCSADPVIDHRHVPFTIVNKQGCDVYIGEATRANVVQDAKRIWSKVINPRDNTFRIPHDGYLKLYQLSKPTIDQYDVILIDEAQDQTPAVIDILMIQARPKILVGDPNQQIYSFRGAVNAMEMFTATTTFYLTQSFRFGSNIAYVANCCLEVLKGQGPKLLVGNTSKGHVDGRQVGQLAILTRTNFALFKEAVIQCSRTAEPPIKIAIAGGTTGFDFDLIKDIYWLMKGESCRIQSKLVKKFSSFHSFETFAVSTSDLELIGKLKIVSHYRDSVISHIDRILAHSVNTLEHADVVLSTAHKSKGLEFSTVRLTNDFTENIIPAGMSRRQALGGLRRVYLPNQQPESPDEFHLIYVAVTRAKKSLQLTPTLMRILHFAGEKFRVPRLSSSMEPPMTCLLTGRKFSPHAISLTRREIKLGNGKVLTPGVYSPSIIDHDMKALSGLYGDQSSSQHYGKIREEPDWAPEVQMYQQSPLQEFLQRMF